MKWPLLPKPERTSDTPFFNLLYLHAAGRGGPDPTIVWVSEVAWDPMQEYLKSANRSAPVMLGTSHLLVQAVGHALALHPEFNRRVVGRRVYPFKEVNVCLASRLPNQNEVNLILIKDVEQKGLPEIAEGIWHNQLAYRRQIEPVIRDRNRLRRLPGWFFRTIIRSFQGVENLFPLPIVGRIDRYRCSPVLVNDFSQKRFPSMRAYKPSRMPDESKSLSVTLGPREEKIVWHDDQPKSIQVAPLCVRADHRICDGFQLSRFVSTMIRLLGEPEAMEFQRPKNSSCEEPTQAARRKSA